MARYDPNPAPGATAGFSWRWWGPVVGGLAADMRLVEERVPAQYSLDIRNGQERCGQRIATVGTDCPTTLSASGGRPADGSIPGGRGAGARRLRALTGP